MSTLFEAQYLDPEWERRKVLSTLQDIRREQIGRAAIDFTDDLQPLVVLAGQVEPFNNGRTVAYRNTQATITFYSKGGWQFRGAQVRFLQPNTKDTIRHYNLYPHQLELDALTPATALQDEHTEHMLRRIRYDRGLAEMAIQAVMVDMGLRDRMPAQRQLDY